MKRLIITIAADLHETGDTLKDMAAHGRIAEAMQEWTQSASADALGIVVSEPEIVEVKAARSDKGTKRAAKTKELPPPPRENVELRNVEADPPFPDIPSSLRRQHTEAA